LIPPPLVRGRQSTGLPWWPGGLAFRDWGWAGGEGENTRGVTTQGGGFGGRKRTLPHKGAEGGARGGMAGGTGPGGPGHPAGWFHFLGASPMGPASRTDRGRHPLARPGGAPPAALRRLGSSWGLPAGGGDPRGGGRPRPAPGGPGPAGPGWGPRRIRGQTRLGPPARAGLGFHWLETPGSRPDPPAPKGTFFHCFSETEPGFPAPGRSGGTGGLGPVGVYVEVSPSRPGRGRPQWHAATEQRDRLVAPIGCGGTRRPGTLEWDGRGAKTGPSGS